MKKYRLQIIAIWFQKDKGLHGAYGVILKSGKPVYLCSAEKWNLKYKDSLDSLTCKTTIINKTIFTELAVKQYLKDGIIGLTVPKELKHLIK